MGQTEIFKRAQSKIKYTTMKHIILVGNTAWSMYNFRGNLMRFLIGEGFKVTVIAPSDSVFEEKIRQTGAQFVSVEMKAKSTNPYTDMMLYLKLRRTLRKLKPDFAFFYTIKPNIYGGMAAQRLGIPYIAVTTGLGYTFTVDNIVSKISRILYKISFKGARQVWFLNNDDKQDFLKYKLTTENKTFILNSEGVDSVRFAMAPQPKDISFILIARMLWDKGVGVYVDSARILKKEYPHVRFKLLGFLNSENPQAINDVQMRQWVQEGTVDYLGVTQDVVPYLNTSTAIVLPSFYREGVPMTLLEGASTGRIVVTTDNTGCRETVDDGKTGFLCKVKDVQSLTECMRKIVLMTPEERTAMGLAARKKIETEFDEKLIFKHYLKTLNHYLS